MRRCPNIFYRRGLTAVAAISKRFSLRSVGTVVIGDLERVRGIEPPYSAWEADVLPLNYIGMLDQEG